jgi:hypothetical protein
MFVEYAYGYFVLAMAMIFVAHRWSDHVAVHIIGLCAAIILIVLALLSVAAQKYATKPVTAIVDQLESTGMTYEIVVTPHIQTLIEILVRMEDQSFFARPKRQHTLSFRHLFVKGYERLRSGRLTDLVWTLRGLFSRGYGTIEMQLLRTIGIEYGYQYTVRRKLFELLYADIFFNGYFSYLVRERGDYSQYRNFIVLKYIENVDVSINGVKYRPRAGQSTLLQMFGVRSMQSITKEQFFVWCLGLPQRAYIHPGILAYYYDLMNHFGIDYNEVVRLLSLPR